MYKGVFADGTKVAVKRLTDYESPAGDAAFQREVEMISVAVHRNLLRLIGFCTTQTERLLVYPFMQNLSVAYRLRGIRCFGNFLYYICSSCTIQSLLFEKITSMLIYYMMLFGAFLCYITNKSA